MTAESPFTSPRSLELVLRIGAFLCFVGHGAFGIIGKDTWLPYFGVVGIGPAMGRGLEPWIGTLDITMGCLMLFRPRLAIGWWMAAWALWTAALRPLSGEPFWEMLERAGNYGVPAMLITLMMPAHWGREIFAPARWRALTDEVITHGRIVLTICVACLLIGHGALGVINKHGIVANYASIFPMDVASRMTPYVGWLEILAAVAVVFRPGVALLVAIAFWKLATESLFLTAGSPVWEVVERGGSYCGPIALAILLAYQHQRQRSADHL